MSDKSNVIYLRKRANPADTEPESGGDFQSFVQRIGAGDAAGAAKNLKAIFNISESRSLECVSWFAERASKSPAFIIEAQQLRVHLMAGDTNSLLVSLYNSFGLQGPEAIAIVGRMRSAISSG